MVSVKVVSYEDRPDRIRLDLSLDEALTLAILSTRVGGKSTTTRRGDIDSIRDQLIRAGVAVDLDDVLEKAGRVVNIDCGVYFTGR